MEQNSRDSNARYCIMESSGIQKKGTRVSTQFITRLERVVKIEKSLRVTLAQATKNLKEAYQRYYELRKDTDDL